MVTSCQGVSPPSLSPLYHGWVSPSVYQQTDSFCYPVGPRDLKDFSSPSQRRIWLTSRHHKNLPNYFSFNFKMCRCHNMRLRVFFFSMYLLDKFPSWLFLSHLSFLFLSWNYYEKFYYVQMPQLVQLWRTRWFKTTRCEYSRDSDRF